VGAWWVDVRQTHVWAGVSCFLAARCRRLGATSPVGRGCKSREPDTTTVWLFLGAGFSGADLANVVNEAAFLAARSATDAVGLPELVEAVQRTR